jgi:hypothetical protein
MKWLSAPIVSLLLASTTGGWALAQAEMLTIICSDQDRTDAFPTMTFHIDTAWRTVEFSGGLRNPNVKVSATISERAINWVWGTNIFALDRYSGVLTRQVANIYVTYWDCKPAHKLIIE